MECMYKKVLWVGSRVINSITMKIIFQIWHFLARNWFYWILYTLEMNVFEILDGWCQKGESLLNSFWNEKQKLWINFLSSQHWVQMKYEIFQSIFFSCQYSNNSNCWGSFFIISTIFLIIQIRIDKRKNSQDSKARALS